MRAALCLGIFLVAAVRADGSPAAGEKTHRVLIPAAPFLAVQRAGPTTSDRSG